MIAVGLSNLIKAQILANLKELKTAGVIGYIIEKDLRNNILELEIPGYPCAILGQSRMDDAWEYQQSNRRVYSYDICVVQLQDNLIGAADIEDIRDAITLVFNNNVTLSGAAPLGITANWSSPVPVSQKGKNLILFYVTIQATTFAYLTYNF